MARDGRSHASTTTPAGLSDRTAELWRSVVPRRARSPERLALLEVALRALDRADQAAEILGREGLTTTTGKTGVVHAHPLIKVEREARALFISAWNALKLTWADLDGRTWD